MRAIDKFILHVVHNWKNELNEAYSEKAIQGFVNKFKEEADDLNIQITDDQLKAYIKTFDRIKEKLPSDQRDLTKWTVSKFIKLVTSTKGEEGVEEIDLTPDVVYHNDNNTIVIFNGSKEANCINYGEGEKWCITRSSFSNYRYNESKSYPTFYLAKNNNLPSSDKLSFVAIQVRNPATTRESDRYVYTNRANSPYESDSMSFEELLNEIPWLRDIPNIKSILKYIPITSQEKITQQYRNNSISYREWAKFPYSAKEQYLVVRKNNKLFSDISNEEFVEKYLSKYPELVKFIAETPGIVDSFTLLRYLDKFPNQIRRSITANLRDKINIKQISSELLPFDVKKLLVQLNKWDIKSDERLYVTKDGDTIVKLTLGDNIEVGLYQAEDDFPNIKLNKRTSKYLLDYPELDKIPLKNLLKLAQDEVIDKNLIIKVLDNAKDDPNSAIIIKPIEDGEVILDSNSFSSYKIDKDGKISSLPFDNEEVQQVFNDSKDNETFQQNALNIFKSESNIPSTIDKDALISVINAIPYNQRTIQYSDTPVVVLTANGDKPFFTMPVVLNPRQQRPLFSYGGRREWRGRDTYTNFTTEQLQSYFTYLRGTNQAFDAEGLKTILGSGGYGMDSRIKKAFIANNPPVADTSTLKPAMNGDTALLINVANPKDSFKISDTSGKLVKANVPSALARQLLGQGQPAAGQVAAQAGGVVRRGRPAGVPNTPATQQPAAIPAGGGVTLGGIMGQYNLTTAFALAPGFISRRLGGQGVQEPIANNRGASRRQNLLGGRGRVVAAYSFGPSDIYIIRLTDQTNIASIVIQPGNMHYVVTPASVFSIDSPSSLLQTLQQRNLAEIHQYLVNEYFDRNPTHLSEFRQLLRQHINEKKKQNENK
jgi:hypothetical protein